MNSTSLRIKDILQKTTQFFREKGIETARLDTELLIASALKWERVKLYLNYDYPLSDDELSLCRDLVRRRAAGEPIAYILGKKDFFRHSFTVNASVLIPRPETELLVEEALAWLTDKCSGRPPRFVDFGTGSGCIGLSIAAELEESQWVGIDLSSSAIDVASLNAEQLGLSERSRFIVSDVAAVDPAHLYQLLGGAADAVVANPPYIATHDPAVDEAVRRFEPDQALFSEEEGLAHIRSWASKAADIVRADGLVIFEIGYQQGRVAKEIFAATGRFVDIEILKDYSGHDRFIRALRNRVN